MMDERRAELMVRIGDALTRKPGTHIAYKHWVDQDEEQLCLQAEIKAGPDNRVCVATRRLSRGEVLHRIGSPAQVIRRHYRGMRRDVLWMKASLEIDG